MNALLVAGDREREVAVAAELARGLKALGWSARVLRAAHEPASSNSSSNPSPNPSPNSARIAVTADGARVVRTDPAPHHWQRTRSCSVARAVRSWLGASSGDERPDVVHILAWRGSTHDLAALCVEAGVPCILTLSDPGFGCLVGDRVRRDQVQHEQAASCTEPLAPSPCLSCAEVEFGPTPWVPIEARFLAVAERRRDALRELQVADRVIVRDAATSAAARVALGDELTRVEFAIVADPTDARAHAELYAAATSRSASTSSPRTSAAQPDWWVERMQVAAEDAWDASFVRNREESR